MVSEVPPRAGALGLAISSSLMSSTSSVAFAKPSLGLQTKLRVSIPVTSAFMRETSANSPLPSRSASHRSIRSEKRQFESQAARESSLVSARRIRDRQSTFYSTTHAHLQRFYTFMQSTKKALTSQTLTCPISCDFLLSSYDLRNSYLAKLFDSSVFVIIIFLRRTT